MAEKRTQGQALAGRYGDVLGDRYKAMLGGEIDKLVRQTDARARRNAARAIRAFFFTGDESTPELRLNASILATAVARGEWKAFPKLPKSKKRIGRRP